MDGSQTRDGLGSLGAVCSTTPRKHHGKGRGSALSRVDPTNQSAGHQIWEDTWGHCTGPACADSVVLSGQLSSPAGDPDAGRPFPHPLHTATSCERCGAPQLSERLPTERGVPGLSMSSARESSAPHGQHAMFAPSLSTLPLPLQPASLDSSSPRSLAVESGRPAAVPT